MIPRLKALARRSLKPLALRVRSFLDGPADLRGRLLLDAVADLRGELAGLTDELELAQGNAEALRFEVADLRRALDERSVPARVARLTPPSSKPAEPKSAESEERADRPVSRIKPRG